MLHVEQAEIDGKKEKSVWLSPQTDKRVHSWFFIQLIFIFGSAGSWSLHMDFL